MGCSELELARPKAVGAQQLAELLVANTKRPAAIDHDPARRLRQPRDASVPEAGINLDLHALALRADVRLADGEHARVRRLVPYEVEDKGFAESHQSAVSVRSSSVDLANDRNTDARRLAFDAHLTLDACDAFGGLANIGTRAVDLAAECLEALLHGFGAAILGVDTHAIECSRALIVGALPLSLLRLLNLLALALADFEEVPAQDHDARDTEDLADRDQVGHDGTPQSCAPSGLPKAQTKHAIVARTDTRTFTRNSVELGRCLGRFAACPIRDGQRSEPVFGSASLMAKNRIAKQIGERCTVCKRTDVEFYRGATECKVCSKARRAAQAKSSTCTCGSPKSPYHKHCRPCGYTAATATRHKGTRAQHGFKTCRTCEQHLSVDEFTPNLKSADKLNARCRKCSVTGLKQWQRTRAGWTSRMRNRYGITADDWDRMYDAQHGKCAACSRAIKRRAYDGINLWTGDGADPDVDHCHETGLVRSLLCCWCNMALTREMTPDALRGLASYLERWREPNRGNLAPCG